MAAPESTSTAPAFKSAHFIGIGGAGMSGIALVLHERGYAVTGSDLKSSRYIRQLTRAGVDIRIGHESQTIDAISPDVVVVSTAIPESNPELMRARELGIPVWPRAKMLSALGQGYTTVAVAGTHGKTTTSSMCATMLDRMGSTRASSSAASSRGTAPTAATAPGSSSSPRPTSPTAPFCSSTPTSSSSRTSRRTISIITRPSRRSRRPS